MDLFDWVFIVSGFIFFTSIIVVLISWTKDRKNLVKWVGYLLIEILKYRSVDDIHYRNAIILRPMVRARKNELLFLEFRSRRNLPSGFQ